MNRYFDYSKKKAGVPKASPDAMKIWNGPEGRAQVAVRSNSSIDV